MEKVTITIDYKGDMFPPIITKEQIRAFKASYAGMSLEIVSNHGFEVHSQELKEGKYFEGVKLTKLVKSW